MKTPELEARTFGPLPFRLCALARSETAGVCSQCVGPQAGSALPRAIATICSVLLILDLDSPKPGSSKENGLVGLLCVPFIVSSHFNYLRGPEGRAWNTHEEQCTFKGLGSHTCCRRHVKFKQDWYLRIFTAALWEDTALTVALQEAKAKSLGKEAAELFS